MSTTVLSEAEMVRCLKDAGVPAVVSDRTARDLIRGLGLPVPDATPSDRVWMRTSLAQDIARRMRAEAHAEQRRDLMAAMRAVA